MLHTASMRLEPSHEQAAALAALQAAYANACNILVPVVQQSRVLFSGAPAFNPDLSTWCGENHMGPDAEPDVHHYFDYRATAWVLPRPNWRAPC
jgi:hypothetical protein